MGKTLGFLSFTLFILCAIPRGYANTGSPAKALFQTGRGIQSLKMLTGKTGRVFKLQIPATRGGVKTFTTVYAALEWEFAAIYENDYSYSEHWNYYVRFYADAAETTPLSLPNNITLHLKWSTDFSGSYSSFIENDAVAQGSTEYVIGDVETDYYDPTFYREVSVDLSPGADYISLN